MPSIWSCTSSPTTRSKSWVPLPRGHDHDHGDDRRDQHEQEHQRQKRVNAPRRRRGWARPGGHGPPAGRLAVQGATGLGRAGCRTGAGTGCRTFVAFPARRRTRPVWPRSRAHRDGGVPPVGALASPRRTRRGGVAMLGSRRQRARNRATQLGRHLGVRHAVGRACPPAGARQARSASRSHRGAGRRASGTARRRASTRPSWRSPPRRACVRARGRRRFRAPSRSA